MEYARQIVIIFNISKILLWELVFLVIQVVIDAMDNMLRIALHAQTALIFYLKCVGQYVLKDFTLILRLTNAKFVQFNWVVLPVNIIQQMVVLIALHVIMVHTFHPVPICVDYPAIALNSKVLGIVLVFPAIYNVLHVEDNWAVPAYLVLHLLFICLT